MPRTVTAMDITAHSGSIEDVSVAEELSSSFTSYAMSTIASRALPDIRDGLKPVHRRILFGMHQMRVTPTGPYKKSARVVGEVMGKYHPHGDAAIYATLVRLSQDFSVRLPLVDGHGNFGSRDDGPAAARYTECRLDAAGWALLDDLKESTVDWNPTYDNAENEPTVLPAAFPNLLVNGAQGIAVGFSSFIPTHNLQETVDAVIHLIRNPNATVDDLRTHITGPDFPTGGQIVDATLLDDIYRTGKGTFRLRARYEITDATARRKAIVVTELPYQVGPEKVVDEVRAAVRDKNLDGLADVRDLTDRKNGMRLVFDLKSGANPENVLAELFSKTSLETTVACSFVVLDQGRPVVADLKMLCEAYVAHRRDVVTRRSEHRLARAERRIHLLEGLLKALDKIDDVVAIIRAAKDDESARRALMKKPGLKLTEVQADHVLDLQLRRLTRLSGTKLSKELNEQKATAASLRKILGSAKQLDAVIIDELEAVGDGFFDARRTALGVNWSPSADAPAELEDEPCVVGFDVTTGELAVNEPVSARAAAATLSGQIAAMTRGNVWVISDRGNLHDVAVEDLPRVKARGKATTLAALTGTDEKLVAVINPAEGDPLFVATAQGVVKRVAADSLSSRAWPLGIIGLKEGDSVVGAGYAADGTELVLVSSGGRLLRTSAAKIRPQGRPAGGVAGLKLGDNETVIAAAAITGEEHVAVGTDSGRAKKTPIAEYPAKGRGGAGVRCIRFLKGETAAVTAFVAIDPLLAPSADPIPDGKRDGSGTPTDLPFTSFGIRRR